MQYIGLTSSSASGKAGGLVASRGRTGAQFRAHAINCQARTPSATQARAITGALPGLWRLLTAAEKSTWAGLASSLPVKDRLGMTITLSGYALWMACSRRLITIGITDILTNAPAVPSIPAVTGFSATPAYDNPDNPTSLTGLELSTTTPLPNNFIPVLRASAAVSNTRAFIRASNLRVIEAGAPWATQPHNALTPWQAIYGTTPPAGTITFELSLVDPISGLVGAPVRATCPYTYTYIAPPPAGTVLIEIEGTPAAQVPNTYFEIEGEPAAN